ncbi:ABC transporter ATP-binding protein [Pelagibius sp.]|uniref:ABC transporter ATP-binding protein n=1 Tax=Pelagibius sp. TaxID=1931238 RepID=UPI0026284927|nr:ABC transporter ATP-binding protein [Pelagibius sp.]
MRNRQSNRRLVPKPLRRAATVFVHFFKAEPLRGCIVLTSMIVAGLLEGVGIAALLPLLDTIINGTAESGSFIGSAVTDSLRSLGIEPTIGVLLLVVVLLITAKSLVLVFVAKQIGYTAATVTMNLRLQLLAALMRARWPFFVRQRMGSISASMTSEPARAASTYIAVARALTGLLQVLVYVALSLAISIEVSFAAVMVGIVSAVLLHRFVVITGKMGQKQTLLTKSLLSGLADGLLSMKPIKAMAREGQLGQILHKDIVAMNKAQQLQILARESLQHYREPITTAALALGLYFILTYWDLRLEGLLVMAFLFLRIVGRVSSLQSNFQSIAGSLPAYWFVRSVLSTATKAAEKETRRLSPQFESEIRLEGVSFSYLRNKPVLREISIEIPKGHFIAVVGESGSGKTTIADLVTGLLRPTSGEIMIDSTPLSAIDKRAWRRMIGYVPQDTPLLHDTVLNNVTLRDPEISEAMARAALEQAEAWSFVSALPQGIHSMVGERGTRVSGGQRQRIAIARALAHRPQLLILDEATAALDPKTEAEICGTLKQLAGELTIIAISHQDALQDAADIIHRIENGRSVQTDGRGGDHMQLSASS